MTTYPKSIAQCIPSTYQIIPLIMPKTTIPPRFGTFATKTREARTGRNPKTGKAIAIPASKTVAFKASSNMKG